MRGPSPPGSMLDIKAAVDETHAREFLLFVPSDDLEMFHPPMVEIQECFRGFKQQLIVFFPQILA